MKELRNDIKTGQYKRAYLFYGDERFLLKYYENELQSKLGGADIFEGNNCDVAQIADAVMTVPFFEEYRFVLVRDSGLFATGRKEDSEYIGQMLKTIPDTSVLVFSETNIDKRVSLFKKLSEVGKAVEFKEPAEGELLSWVTNVVKKGGREISREDASYFLRITEHDMNAMHNELAKLTAYSEGAVTKEQIDRLCTKSVESKVFELVDAIGQKRPQIALSIFSNMVLMKESPIMVLSMIIRQFRILQRIKTLSAQGKGSADIAKAAGIRSFFLNEYLRQTKNFSDQMLIAALKDCLQADTDIKSGNISDKLAVEVLIARYGS